MVYEPGVKLPPVSDTTISSIVGKTFNFLNNENLIDDHLPFVLNCKGLSKLKYLTG